MTVNTQEMNREQLEATAKDLGVEFRANVGDDTLRQRINDTLGNVDPEPQASNPPPAPEPADKSRRKRIIMATHDQDTQPVQVGVNGRMYVIERGVEVTVPESVIEVLNHAMQHVYDPRTMKESRVMAYPFQVLGDA